MFCHHIYVEKIQQTLWKKIYEQDWLIFPIILPFEHRSVIGFNGGVGSVLKNYICKIKSKIARRTTGAQGNYFLTIG